MTRHGFWAPLLGLILCSGCSSDNNRSFRQFIEIFQATAQNPFRSSSISLKQAADIPYASMGWRQNGGSQSIVVLATETNGEQLWTSAAHIVFLTQSGRIKRTLGLSKDLSGMTNSAPLPAPAQALAGPYTTSLAMDFADIGVYGAAVKCRGQARGARSVKILGKLISTTLVTEDCTSDALHWSFTNRYWIDRESGLVWRSEQSIHPGGGKIQTEIFRPPG